MVHRLSGETYPFGCGSRAALPFLLALAVAASACSTSAPVAGPGAPAPQVQPPPATPAPQPAVVRDTQLEQKLARTELQLIEKEAQVEELQLRLDDARREVVRAMAKLQSLATRAEAASAMAEAEIALRALRASAGPEAGQELGNLMQLSTGEFSKQNYGGALYLASQAKNAALAAQGRLTGVERGSVRPGETAFALPLQLQTTARANVREGPGGGSQVLFTLAAGASVTGLSTVDQWVRVTEESGRRGWIHQSLISRRSSNAR